MGEGDASLQKRLRKIKTAESGAIKLEYALLITAIAATMVAVVYLFGESVISLYQSYFDNYPG